MAVSADHREAKPVPLPMLFVAMLKVSLYGIGGGAGLVWARRIAVEQEGWLDEHEFADIVSLCQFMPGPNIVGIATCIGTRMRGAPGAGAAIAGFLLMPWLIGFALGLLFLQYAHHAVLRGVLGGVAAVAAGLLIAIGLRMLRPYRSRPAAIVFAGLAFALIAIVKLPLLVVLFGVTPVSIAVMGLPQRRAS